MSFFFGNLDSEISDLLNSVNTLAKANTTSIDQLRSGVIIGKIIAAYLSRDKLEGILPGKTKEIWQCNWEVILSHSQSLLPEEWRSIRAYEIISDSGLLLTIAKLLLKKLQKGEKFIERKFSRVIQSHQGPQVPQKKQRQQTPGRSISKSQAHISLPLESRNVPTFSSISEDLKTKIHTWLVELQVLPPTLFLHEFIYRMRTGISLCDLINRLEGRAEVIHGVHKNPKTISYCIANINKTLEYLRKISKVNSKYLWSSAEIHEGSEEHIYGLLNHIREFYMQRYPNFIPRSSSRSRSCSAEKLRRRKSEESMFTPMSVTNSMKRSVIQWINSLGLERFVVYHKDQRKDYFYNGILLCEVIGEIYQHRLKYTFRPSNESQCLENFNLALRFLKHRIVSEKVPVAISVPSENLSWAVLWEIMNNKGQNLLGVYDTVGMKDLEESLIEWIDSLRLLPPRVTTILELVPNFRNGVLLAQLVSAVFPDKKLEMISIPQTDHAALLNIRRALAVLRNELNMSQKFTWKDKELHQGDLKVIFGLLEDLHKCCDGGSIKTPKKSETRPYLGSSYLSSTLKSLQTIEIPPARNIEKVRELEEWVKGIGLECSGLVGDVLMEFKSGEKLCELVALLERKELEGVHSWPKTSAAALANIRKALEFWSKKPGFNSKFTYLDDQILSGNSKVIRSLLMEVKRMYKNRLLW